MHVINLIVLTWTQDPIITEYNQCLYHIYILMKHVFTLIILQEYPALVTKKCTPQDPEPINE